MSVVEPLQILVGVCKVTGLAFVIVVSFNIKSRIKWLNLGEKLVTAALLLTSIVLRHKSPNGPWLECLKAALCLASTTEVCAYEPGGIKNSTDALRTGSDELLC